MAKFFGAIGYGDSVKTGPGVYEDVIIERNAVGDVRRNTRRSEPGESVNDNLVLGNSISIVSDPYILSHIPQIRYVVWMGTRWKVRDIEIEHPRLLLKFGEVYNGPTPEATESP